MVGKRSTSRLGMTPWSRRRKNSPICSTPRAYDRPVHGSFRSLTVRSAPRLSAAIAMSLIRLRGEPARLFKIFRLVDVEERVDRRRRPVGEGGAVARRPYLDLAQSLVDQGVAQVVAERDRPEPDDRMAPFAGAGAGQGFPGCQARRMQPRSEIVRQKWAVARHADDPGEFRCVVGGPVES